MMRKTIFQLGIAVIILVLTVATYGAWYSHVAQLSSRAAELRSQVEEHNQESVRVLHAQSELAALSGDESTVYHYFVSQTDIVPYLESLQAIGSGLSSKVEVVSVSADTAKPQGHLSLTVKVTGSFSAVLRTLGAIEYEAYDTKLTSMTLTTPPEATNDPVWTATAQFLVGTTPQAPAPGSTKKS